MADYTYKIVTTRRMEFTLNSPTNWAEVEKVFAKIKNNLTGKKLFDDTVSVQTRDDELVISYDMAEFE